LNLPGESASVVTCLDGYQMARKGRAGPALGIAAISSFVAGTFGVLALMLIAPPVARFALRFGPPEYFGLMALGLTMVVFLAGKSMIKGLLSALFGLWLATVGADLFTAESRFTFGYLELLDGIDFIVATIGIFAIAEVLANLESQAGPELFKTPKGLRNLLPTLQDLKQCRFAFLNASVVGFFLGVLPGAGSTIASFISYGFEKAFSRYPEKFGTGVVEGVAAPEGANNSETGGALVPLLTLGIPGSNTTAILLAALILWGFRPGPLLIQENPGLFWGLVASMYVGNLMLLILNLPLVPVFAQILRLPYYALYPIILGVSMVGVYSVSQSLFDVWMMGLFGLLGYLMKKLDFPAAPLILGMVLGDAIERALRQSLMMSRGDIAVFFQRPLSAVMLLLAVVLLSIPLAHRVRSWRVKAMEQEL
jgi:putative tricarboxylic transport membrane protein